MRISDPGRIAQAIQELQLEKVELEARLRVAIACELAMFKQRTGQCVSGMDVEFKTMDYIAAPREIFVEKVKVYVPLA